MKLIIALILCTLPSFGAIAVVQASSGDDNSGGGGTTIATSATATTAHNAIIAFVGGGTCGVTATGVTDTAGNTYYQFLEQGGAATYCLRGFIARDIVANATNVLTGTYSPGSVLRGITAIEVSGLETVTLRDATTSNFIQTSGSSLATAPFSTFWKDEIIIVGAYCQLLGTWTAGTGYTIPSGATSPHNDVTIQYKIVSARQTNVTASITTGTSGGVLNVVGVSLIVPVPRAGNSGAAN